MSKFLAGEGEAVEAGANRSFLLDVGGVWFVEQGRMDVFCVRLAADGTVAGRTHIARVPAGQCLFGHDADSVGSRDAAGGMECEGDSGAAPAAPGDEASGEGATDPRENRGALQAVGSAGTTLRFLDEDAARRRFEEGPLRTEGARLIDQWVDALYAGLVTGVMPQDRQALRPPSIVRLRPATMAGTRTGVAWIGHVEGRSRLLGRSELPLLGLPIPCSARAWFVASTASTVRVTSTLALLERRDLWTSLEAFQRLVTRGSLMAMHERSAGDRLRQRRRDAARDALVGSAFTELVAVHDAPTDASRLQGLPGATAAGPDTLALACRQVGAALGLPLAQAARAGAGSSADPVTAIARASGVRVRQVLLDERWWRSDSGPLLGRTARGKSTGSPCCRRPPAAMRSGIPRTAPAVG